MNYHKLLNNQINRYLPESIRQLPELQKMLSVINDSYNAYERDRELSDRAFSISEEEYVEINQRLKHELQVKKKSVEQLKQTIGVIEGDERTKDSDDLLMIARYLNQQVNKRKSAEIVFSSLITNLPSAILLEDENRHISYANQYFCDLFGIPVPPEALQGMDCKNSAEDTKNMFLNPETFVEEINHVLAKRQLVKGQVLELVDGRVLERDYIPIFIEQKYKGHLWSYSDITKKRKAELELKSSEERWQFALEGAGDGVWEYDLETKSVFYSKQYKKMLGYEEDEFKNEQSEWYNKVHPDDQGLLSTTLQDYAENKIKSHAREYRIMHKNGHYLWILDRGTVIARFENGMPKRIIGTHADFTDRKKVEEEYKRISLVASANNSGVLFTKPDGKITWANDGFLKITGYSLGEVIGKTPIELCKGPLTDKASLDKMLNSFYSLQPFSVELLFYKKDGTSFWGRTNTQPVMDSKGTEFFGIIDDITDERELENHFRFVLEKIGDNVWEHDFSTGETKFSDNETHLFGFSKSDFASNVELWWNNVYPDDKPLLEMSNKKYLSGEQTHHAMEYRMIHKSGEIRWVLDKGVVIEKTDDDKPLRIIGTHTDITSIKQAEYAIRESEKQFKSIAENIPGVLYKYEYDDGGNERFTYISPECEKKIGLTEEQLQHFNEIIHPDDAEREKALSRAARDGNTSYYFEGRFKVPNKPVIWLSFSSSFSHENKDGKKVYAGIILNTTKDKEAESILQMRERKYRNIIANMNLGLIEVDNEETIQFANQSFCEMSGYKMDELIGKKASKLFVRDESIEMMEMKNQQRLKGVSDAYEILTKNKKGEPKWWLISGAPRYNDNGELIGSIGIHLDITAQKKIEHELLEAREQAESSVKAKQIFLANMSHEIRTPMNAIIGMANQLRKSTLNTDQQFYLNIINSSANNLLIIINDILDLSKLEAGKLSLEEIGFKPKSLIEQTLQVMTHKAEEKGLILTMSFFDPEIFPVLVGDPYRINQILLNLFSNAIKFTEKGSVAINCRMLIDTAQSQTIEFTVKDTGIGMDDAFMKNLFQKFRQEDDSITRRYGGTGLGMSICKELVEYMGGKISVQSKKGEGTSVTFTILFKKGTMQQLPKKQEEITSSSNLSGKRILVTDDNEMNRLVAVTILKNYAVVLEEAQNGVEAIEKIKNGKFDLVLMDVQMPKMDGLEATKFIRKNISETLPIIALTALALKGDENKFRSAGMNDYLSKPFEEPQLVNMISRWLGVATVSQPEVKEAQTPGTIYDLSKLKEIAKGNQEFIDKMVNMFIEQAPSSVKEIVDAFEAKDFVKVNKVAHRFKTSVNNMGIYSLKNEISELELLADSNPSSAKIKVLVSKLDSVITEVVKELKHLGNESLVKI
jgi:two-component system, sensor histidine kinase